MSEGTMKPLLLSWVSQWIGHSQCEAWTKESSRTMLTLAPEAEWVDDIPVPHDNVLILLPPAPNQCPPSIVVE